MAVIPPYLLTQIANYMSKYMQVLKAPRVPKQGLCNLCCRIINKSEAVRVGFSTSQCSACMWSVLEG